MATEDEKLIITAAEAESLLVDGAAHIHNFVQAGPILLGCDYDRAHAIEAFRTAASIEIGGEGCKAVAHPIVVWRPASDVGGPAYSFFKADMDKVAAFEAQRKAVPE